NMMVDINFHPLTPFTSVCATSDFHNYLMIICYITFPDHTNRHERMLFGQRNQLFRTSISNRVAGNLLNTVTGVSFSDRHTQFWCSVYNNSLDSGISGLGTIVLG